ncbi:nuclear transport factor 2 family protein [Bradyrhizobium sp. TZ2]
MRLGSPDAMGFGDAPVDFDKVMAGVTNRMFVEGVDMDRADGLARRDSPEAFGHWSGAHPSVLVQRKLSNLGRPTSSHLAFTIASTSLNRDTDMSTTVEWDMTWEEANASLAKSMDRFQRHDVEGILSRYDENISIRFADLPEIRGRTAAEQFLPARFSIQKDYNVHKSLLLVSGQKYANSFTATWVDATSGKHYEARGVEALELRGGKVINWDCSYNLWEAGTAKEMGYFRDAV